MLVMLIELRKWLWAKREAIYQGRTLATIPKRDFYVDCLRRLRPDAIQEAMSSPVIAAEWERTRDEIGRAVNIADGNSWGVNPGDRRALWHFAFWMRPKRVLEIGTNVGASTCHLAAAYKRYGNGGGSEYPITTVDIVDVNDGIDGYWRKYGLERSPRGALSELGCDALVKFVVGDSVEFMNSDAQTYDLIFLDGDHSAFKVYEEVSTALRLLNPSGLILLHDYFPNNRALWNDGAVVPGPHLAVSRMVRERASLQVLPFGSLPWPTKLGSHTTSLAVVARGNV